MQLVVRRGDINALQIEDEIRDPRETFEHLSSRQFQIALETNELPRVRNGDLAITYADHQLARETEQAVAACHDKTAEHKDDVLSASIDRGAIGIVLSASMAELLAKRDQAVERCRRARHAYDVARGKRRAYELKHVPHPEWANYYDKVLPICQGTAIGGDLILGAILLVLGAQINGGLETVLPALALTTYLSVKLGRYVGTASFRWSGATRFGKFKLAGSITFAGAIVVGLNVGLGLLRSGLDLSLRAFGNIATDVLQHLGGLTVTGIGLALFAFLASTARRKLMHGFTEEYRELRNNEKSRAMALERCEAVEQASVNGAYVIGVQRIEAAANEAEDDYLETLESRRQFVKKWREVRRQIAGNARVWGLRVLDYCQRLVASWPAGPTSVPSHYRSPPPTQPGALWDAARYPRSAQSMREKLGRLFDELEGVRTERDAALKKLTDARISSAAAITAASSVPDGSSRREEDVA